MGSSSVDTVDMGRVREILRRDPAWAAYAIADLQPAFAPHCRWFVSAAGQEEAVVLLFTALSPPILLTVGTPGAVALLLESAVLPDRVFISARHEHVPAIEQQYRFDLPAQGTSFHRMQRMILRRREVLSNVALGRVRRLGRADVGQIEGLLRHGGPYTPDAFDPYQLDEGVFYGVEGVDELLAMGGTHIVDWQGGVGAIGNMYTHPAERGQGYARLVLAAVIHTLQAGGVETIILNVNEQNQTARRLYTQYGFDEHCGFAEGIGVKVAG